jgi:hypothetical protein
LARIDHVLLRYVTAATMFLHRRFGMDRHAVIREFLTAGVVSTFVAAAIGVTCISYWLLPLLLALPIFHSSFPGRWREANGRSKASDTIEGWRADMELASIHARLRIEMGWTFLLIDLSLVCFYVFHSFLWLYAGIAPGAAIALLFGLHSATETFCRYVLSVPPPPPGSGRSDERSPYGATPIGNR